MSREKKSLQAARTEAVETSKAHPGLTVRVMDKPRKTAVVTVSDWVYRERILDGWHTVEIYIDGKPQK